MLLIIMNKWYERIKTMDIPIKYMITDLMKLPFDDTRLGESNVETYY